MLPVALQSTKVTATSNFIAKPASVDPSAKDRRRRPLGLTGQSFPDGEVPGPLTSAWLGLSQDVAANKLSFILVLRTAMASVTDMSENSP